MRFTFVSILAFVSWHMFNRALEVFCLESTERSLQEHTGYEKTTVQNIYKTTTVFVFICLIIKTWF